MAQTMLTGHGERRIAAATNATNSTKDSVTNVKNETNRTKEAYIGYSSRDRRSYIVTRTSQVSVARSRFQTGGQLVHAFRSCQHAPTQHARLYGSPMNFLRSYFVRMGPGRTRGMQYADRCRTLQCCVPAFAHSAFLPVSTHVHGRQAGKEQPKGYSDGYRHG